MRSPQASFSASFVGTICFVLPATLALTASCVNSTADIFQAGAGGTGGTVSGQTGTTNPQSTNNTTSGKTSTSTNGPGTTNATGTNATTTTTDVTSTSQVTSSVQVSSSSGPPINKVDCDTAGTCNTNTSVCCWNNQFMQASCTSPSACQPSNVMMRTAISCQFQYQCPGQICCAFRYFGQDNQPYESAKCTSTCDLPDRYLCNPQNPACPIYTDAQGMPVQSVCTASSLLPPGYFVCGFPQPGG